MLKLDLWVKNTKDCYVTRLMFKNLLSWLFNQIKGNLHPSIVTWRWWNKNNSFCNKPCKISSFEAIAPKMENFWLRFASSMGPWILPKFNNQNVTMRKDMKHLVVILSNHFDHLQPSVTHHDFESEDLISYKG